MDFAGTLSAAPRTYLDLLGDLIDNLVTHGFRRIVLLNGHGGNIVPAGQAVFEARQRYRERTDLLAALGDLLALGVQAETARSVARAGSDGPRLRVGDLDDLAPRARPGRRSEPGRSRFAANAVRAGVAGLDHQGSKHSRPHR